MSKRLLSIFPPFLTASQNNGQWTVISCLPISPQLYTHFLSVGSTETLKELIKFLRQWKSKLISNIFVMAARKQLRDKSKVPFSWEIKKNRLKLQD